MTTYTRRVYRTMVATDLEGKPLSKETMAKIRAQYDKALKHSMEVPK